MSLQSQNIQKQVKCLLSIRLFMEVVKYTQDLMKCLYQRLTGRNIRKLFRNIDLNWKKIIIEKKDRKICSFLIDIKKLKFEIKFFFLLFGALSLWFMFKLETFFYKKRHTSVYLLSNRFIIFYFLFFLCLFYYFNKRVFHQCSCFFWKLSWWHRFS